MQLTLQFDRGFSSCQTHQEIHDLCQTLNEEERRELSQVITEAANRVARLIREERK